eukprot:m51a1_g14307 hypothetical protein (358) ;mRNA; f:474664-476136
MADNGYSEYASWLAAATTKLALWSPRAVGLVKAAKEDEKKIRLAVKRILPYVGGFVGHPVDKRWEIKARKDLRRIVDHQVMLATELIKAPDAHGAAAAYVWHVDELCKERARRWVASRKGPPGATTPMTLEDFEEVRNIEQGRSPGSGVGHFDPELLARAKTVRARGAAMSKAVLAPSMKRAKAMAEREQREQREPESDADMADSDEAENEPGNGGGKPTTPQKTGKRPASTGLTPSMSRLGVSKPRPAAQPSASVAAAPAPAAAEARAPSRALAASPVAAAAAAVPKKDRQPARCKPSGGASGPVKPPADAAKPRQAAAPKAGEREQHSEAPAAPGPTFWRPNDPARKSQLAYPRY